MEEEESIPLLSPRSGGFCYDPMNVHLRPAKQPLILYMTNSFTSLLNQSISEIDDFAKTEAGKEWESSWYDDLKQLVLRAASENNPERAEEL